MTRMQDGDDDAKEDTVPINGSRYCAQERRGKRERRKEEEKEEEGLGAGAGENFVPPKLFFSAKPGSCAGPTLFRQVGCLFAPPTASQAAHHEAEDERVRDDTIRHRNCRKLNRKFRYLNR